MTIRIGGDFFFDSSSVSSETPLLLLAGGVGINPLASIILEACQSRLSNSIVLLYSAKSQDELLFKVRNFQSFPSLVENLSLLQNQFTELASNFKNFHCVFFETGNKHSKSTPEVYSTGQILSTHPVTLQLKPSSNLHNINAINS